MTDQPKPRNAAEFFAGREASRDRTHVTSETSAFFYADDLQNRALSLNRQPTFGERRFAGCTERHEVTNAAVGYYEGILPSRDPRLGFVYSAGFRWELTDPTAWLRAGKPDLTEAARRMLLASVRQLASQAGPTTAAAAQADIERRLVGSPVDIAGGAGTASLTNLTLQPDLPPDQTAGQAWTFATLDPRLPAADDVQFTVALTLNWRVHEPVTWHLERINEPAGLCQEILAREVGLILRAFRHDEAADAQETARKQLVGAPLDVGHGLQTVLRSIRVTLGPSSRPVDLSSHSAEFDATLPTRDPAIPLDAKVDISWRVRDQVRWTRQPIEDLPLRCQAEATRRLRAVTTHYIWQDMAAAQQHIDEHVCPTDIDVDGSVELRIVSVRLTPPAGLMKSGQELENATVGVKITEERLKGQAARREWELKHAFELQKAFDDGVHPIVLKAIVDPPNAAKAFTELSAQQQAEQRMQFEFAAELAKAGQVSTELARKILAAQSALGIPADSEPLPVGRRGRPRPLPVPKDQDAVPEIAARATEGDTEKIADEVTDEEIPEGTDNQQAASGSGS